MSAKVTLITVFIIGSFLVTPLLADTPNPRKIFKGNYVTGSSQAGSSSNKGVDPNIVPNNAQYNSFEKSLPKDNPLDSVTVKETKKSGGFTPLGEEPQQEEEEEIELERTAPLTGLSLIINGTDPKKSLDSVRTFTNIVVEYDIEPEAIHLLDVTSPLLRNRPPEFEKLMFRGAALKTNRKIGSKYGITRVPAWIARTTEGYVVLEGYEEISSLINLKGELRLSHIKKQAERLSKQTDAINTAIEQKGTEASK